MGMARGAEEDSADSQWYITDNEQHGLIRRIGMMEDTQFLVLLEME